MEFANATTASLAGASRLEGGRVAVLSFVEHEEPVDYYSTTLLVLPHQETLRRRMRDARGPDVNILPEEDEAGGMAMLINVHGSVPNMADLNKRQPMPSTQLSVVVDFVHVFEEEEPEVSEDLRDMAYNSQERHPIGPSVPYGVDYAADLEYAQGMGYVEDDVYGGGEGGSGYDIAARSPDPAMVLDFEAQEELLRQRERNREAERAAREIMTGMEKTTRDSTTFVGDNGGGQLAQGQAYEVAPERQLSPAPEGQEEHVAIRRASASVGEVDSPVVKEDIVTQEVLASSPLPRITLSGLATATEPTAVALGTAHAGKAAAIKEEADTVPKRKAAEMIPQEQEAEGYVQPAPRALKRTKRQREKRPRSEFVERAAEQTKRRKIDE